MGNRRNSTVRTHTPEWVEQTIQIGGKEIKFNLDVSPYGMARYQIALENYFGYMREQEVASTNFSKRKLPWNNEGVAGEIRLVCNLPPNRATVKLVNHIFWRAEIESPYEFIDSNFMLAKLEDALTWAEDMLLSDKEQSDFRYECGYIPPAYKSFHDRFEELLTPALMEELQPYWLKPDDLEPKQPTYKVFLQVDCKPHICNTLMLSFGEEFVYDAEYFSPAQFAEKMYIDAFEFEIDEPWCKHGVYKFSSRAVYYDAAIATKRAQKLDDVFSAICKNKYVLRARFGLLEIETGYIKYLGVFQNTKKPWGRIETREEYMVRHAFMETLARAGKYSAFNKVYWTDDTLHYWSEDHDLLRYFDVRLEYFNRRSKSKHISEEEREQSRLTYLKAKKIYDE